MDDRDLEGLTQLCLSFEPSSSRIDRDMACGKTRYVYFNNERGGRDFVSRSYHDINAKSLCSILEYIDNAYIYNK